MNSAVGTKLRPDSRVALQELPNVVSRQKQGQVHDSGVRKSDAVGESERLVARAREGDAAAFSELVVLLSDRVHNTCWRICGNLEDARDLTQDTFVRAFERLESFQGNSQFSTWVHRLAVNLTLSHLRKAKSRRASSLDHLSAGTEFVQPLPRVAEMAPDDALRERVELALERIDPDFRAVVVLRDIEGYEYREIAEILEIAPGTVKSRLHRARMALRELLKPDLND